MVYYTAAAAVTTAANISLSLLISSTHFAVVRWSYRNVNKTKKHKIGRATQQHGYSSAQVVSIVPACALQREKHQHCSGDRHYSAYCHYVLAVVPTCVKRFHRHCSGKPALLNRHYIEGDHYSIPGMDNHPTLPLLWASVMNPTPTTNHRGGMIQEIRIRTRTRTRHQQQK